ncbi:MAG: hypothetical protein CO094_06095 [Anaerolineae bacterium CG_4_9_14_3_um_filter_57_17]|nr:SRPBCC family protein [bacterium]NCT21377.1 SRPBCC family protein [bacterium]OIO83724.1 MAG: hypothetical protein AUK01_11960 [Anaerolineae bacterium CG2_30_57_67]PJB66787.1 MAG: hypothetical protein CO094_06095 [Anaerolineae bacterium CG_4_9_14_3_um_filter_57_17]
MKTATFTYDIHATCPREKAQKMLSEFSQHSQIHPLIMKVETAPPPPDVLRRYWITDRLKWGIFTFNIRYRADILRVSDEEILTEACQSPRTTVRNHTTLSESGGETHIHVEMTLTAPDLLFDYAFSQAQTAHLEMARRIKTTLENPKI